jgi:hypothetical protein
MREAQSYQSWMNLAGHVFVADPFDGTFLARNQEQPMVLLADARIRRWPAPK